MNRVDLQKIADIRAAEARMLLDGGSFLGAYYLAGYAVECALKACIAKQIKEHDFPDKKFIVDSHTHKLTELLGLAGLRQRHSEYIRQDQAFALNWAVVKDWTPEERYSLSITEKKARDLFDAVTDQKSGILPWLKTHW